MLLPWQLVVHDQPAKGLWLWWDQTAACIANKPAKTKARPALTWASVTLPLGERNSLPRAQLHCYDTLLTLLPPITTLSFCSTDVSFWHTVSGSLIKIMEVKRIAREQGQPTYYLRQGVMFRSLYVCPSVCLFVCLFVRTISQKVLNADRWNFQNARNVTSRKWLVFGSDPEKN